MRIVGRTSLQVRFRLLAFKIYGMCAPGIDRCTVRCRYYGQMGRGEATECYLIQARKSTDNDGRTWPRSLDPPIIPTSSNLDRMQVLH
jgi:hypothetical protein